MNYYYLTAEEYPRLHLIISTIKNNFGEEGEIEIGETDFRFLGFFETALSTLSNSQMSDLLSGNTEKITQVNDISFELFCAISWLAAANSVYLIRYMSDVIEELTEDE